MLYIHISMVTDLRHLLLFLAVGSLLCISHNQGRIYALNKKKQLSWPCTTCSTASNDGRYDEIRGLKGDDDFDKEDYYSQCGAFDGDVSDIDDDDGDDSDDGNVERTLFHTVVVDWYGAVGNGVTDDTKAFQEAWKEACALDSAILMIPDGKTYLVGPLDFKGPCGNNLVVQFEGMLVAPSDPREWNLLSSNAWINFIGLNNLTVEGWGKLDGQGQKWWEQSCKRNTTNICVDAPSVLLFKSVHNLRVRNLDILNSPQIHIKFSNCDYVQAMNIRVNAPEDSPNTDGIHVSETRNILIQDTQIRSGDDCVSIVSGSSNIKMKNIACGPGHGISIGSLGEHGNEAHVSRVAVDGAILTNTHFGLRIKTWRGGTGSVTNVGFQNVEMYNVSKPIVINQNYCDSRACYLNEDTAVQVSLVCYRNIWGTSTTKKAIDLDCSDVAPCKNLYFENVELLNADKQTISSSCKNAQVFAKGIIIPSVDCLVSAKAHVLHSIL